MTSNEVGDCNSIDVGYLYCGLPEGDDQVTGRPDLKANSHQDVVSNP